MFTPKPIQSLFRYAVIAAALLAPFTLTLSSCSKIGLPKKTAPGSAESGVYQNLFAEAGVTSENINAHIEHSFQQLFYGDPETQAVYYPAGENENGALAYIFDVNSNDVRSEGLSYGMMIAVQLNKKTEFDAIWNWAHTYMYQSNPKHPAYGYFAWSMTKDGNANDPMPAPDGEEYFITALYFAAARWGNGAGIYHYQQQADLLLHNVLHRKQITGQTLRGEMTATNLFDTEAKMVRFTPDVENANRTDPSYHLPAFYEVWARVGPQTDRQFWREAAQVSRDYFISSAHPQTALTPDYANFDGSPWAAPWHPDSAHFRVDAWRSIMNWSMDWAWWARDVRQIELSNRLQSFFTSQGLDNYGNSYSLDGKKLSDNQSAGLIAMNATGGLAADHPQRLEFVTAFWDTPVPQGQYRYFDGMLYLMALLHCAGEYKVWLPQTPE